MQRGFKLSNITKRMLSLSLKKLLSRTTLDNITVQAVTEDAEVSRKTFYYHFHDVYDLLKWTLTEETRRFMETEFEPSSIDQGLDAFVDFLLQNRGSECLPLIGPVCH